MASEFRTVKERRKVLAGYPIEEPFNSIHEVRNYLNNDKIVCLLCGKKYKSLGLHLVQIHEMEVDTYREKYKIPWRYGLTGVSSKENYRNNMLKTMSKGYDPSENYDVNKIINSKKRKSFHMDEIRRINAEKFKNVKRDRDEKGRYIKVK